MADYIRREDALKGVELFQCGWAEIEAVQADYIGRLPDDDVVQVPHCKDCPQWKPNTGTSDDSGGRCFGHDPCSAVKPKKGEQNNE